MHKTNNKALNNKKWKISLIPVLRYQTIICVFVVLTVLLGGIPISVTRIKDRMATVKELQSQTEYRVSQSLNLLNSLAEQKQFYDPQMPVEDKIKVLDSVNKQFGYMMMCYVDSDVNVYSADSEPVSLASRDYMQRLFSTGRSQVTDSFAAGADGVTLNYTIAVPLIRDGEITGCLFCAIYFDEIVEMLKNHMDTLEVESVLIGSQNQIMSSTNNMNYGDSYIDKLKSQRLFGTKESKIEADLIKRSEGSFWSMGRGGIKYTYYVPIEGTEWKLVSSSNLASVYLSVLPGLIPTVAVSILMFAVMIWLVSHYMRKQMRTVDMLIQSVSELEKKIYQDDRPDEMGIDGIIRLTSKGLSDGLTGVVTRTVFMDQFKALLNKGNGNKILALCFVDLDNLKTLNDTYGHEVGDISLKNVGYVLREYEKKYDGLVGRYGGDEFILILSDIDNDEELREVLDELSMRLHMIINQKGREIEIRCSIGVSIWEGSMDTDSIIKQADEALYFVKQNGKGYYKIFQD